MRAFLDARLDDAERLALEALALAQQAQIEEVPIVFAPLIFVVRALQGRLTELEPAFRAIIEQHPEQIAVRRASFAWMLAELDREHEARPEFEALASRDFDDIPRNGMWALNMSMAAMACAYFGDRSCATKLYERFRPYEDLVLVSGNGAVCTGSAATALGELAQTLERFDDAERHFERAIAVNRRLRAPAITARSQGLYAAMLVTRGRPGDIERARELSGEAMAVGERIGVKSVVESATELLRRIDELPRRPSATPPAVAIGTVALRREGEYWTLETRRSVFRLKDAKGLHYLEHLLGSPQLEFYALDLVASEEAGRREPVPATAAAATASLGVRTLADEHAGELLDPQAKAAYRARLEDLEAEIEEGERFNDPERAARARAEREMILSELSSAFGLGGRDRLASSASERARVNVTRALKGTIRRIGEQDAALGRHLSGAVRTGTFCSYRPDPDGEVGWELGEAAAERPRATS
jgi:tetratricopeptide (TPR) repeat protein